MQCLRLKSVHSTKVISQSLTARGGSRGKDAPYVEAIAHNLLHSKIYWLLLLFIGRLDRFNRYIVSD